MKWHEKKSEVAREKELSDMRKLYRVSWHGNREYFSPINYHSSIIRLLHTCGKGPD